MSVANRAGGTHALHNGHNGGNNSGGIGGNTPTQDVTQPGTFVIAVTSGGCTATDTVVVFVDTATPRAIIRPVTQTVTCAVESVQLNGTASTPTGRIGYLWFLNGIPFDNNPITDARAVVPALRR